jgi:multiple antibiotic resistance protein
LKHFANISKEFQKIIPPNHKLQNKNEEIKINLTINQSKFYTFTPNKKDMLEIDFREIITVGMVLFAVIDIVGTIPIIVDLRAKHGHIESEKASLVAGIIMIVFLFIGEEFLSLIGIDVHSFAVAGSFVLFFLALEMILGIRIYRDEEANSASIVPLAFPLIAGAGTMTTLLSLRSQFHTINIVIAIILNIILVYIVLKSSSKLEKMLGKNGLGVIRKAFGVVLLAIAVKLFAANVKGLFV